MFGNFVTHSHVRSHSLWLRYWPAGLLRLHLAWHQRSRPTQTAFNSWTICAVCVPECHFETGHVIQITGCTVNENASDVHNSTANNQTTESHTCVYCNVINIQTRLFTKAATTVTKHNYKVWIKWNLSTQVLVLLMPPISPSNCSNCSIFTRLLHFNSCQWGKYLA